MARGIPTRPASDRDIPIRMGHRPRPLRLAYGGAVLKLRATQLRPERELTQAGAELIGTDSLPAVIEILRVDEAADRGPEPDIGDVEQHQRNTERGIR